MCVLQQTIMNTCVCLASGGERSRWSESYIRRLLDRRVLLFDVEVHGSHLSFFLSLTLSFDSLGYKSSTDTTFFELHLYLYLQLTGTLTLPKFQRSTDLFYPHYLPLSLSPSLSFSLSLSLSLSDGFSPSCRSMPLGSVARCQPSQGTQRGKMLKNENVPRF